MYIKKKNFIILYYYELFTNSLVDLFSLHQIYLNLELQAI